MYAESVVKQVNEVLHENFEIPMEKLVPEANIVTDLELDSLDAVDMLVHLEDHLDVKVDATRFQNVKTVGDIYAIVADVVVAKS